MLIDIQSDRSEKVKYDYSDLMIYLRKGLLSAFPNYAADSHWHDDLEFIYVNSGHMLYNVNGQIVMIQKGEGIFVNARQLHYGFSDDMSECEFICFLFHPIILCSTKTFEQQYISPVVNSNISHIHLFPQITWQNKVLCNICAIYENAYGNTGESNSLLYIQGLIFLLWNEIFTYADFAKQAQSSPAKIITLKSMIQYIHNNYDKKIPLQDIAASGLISKRTCEGIFMQYLNKTPISYLTEYRLRKSIELMKNTDMTILEIGLTVGFSGASYYAESFRKQFGKSPSEYRKEMTK